MTEHLEYLPYKNDIIITDRNRSFNISKALLIKDELLMIVNGSEITKPMPPGHFNAIFVKDVNPLLNSNGEKSMIEANMNAQARRKVVDKIAAAVMLQGWLDHADRLKS